MKIFISVLCIQILWVYSFAQTTTGALQGKLLSIEGTPVESANLILAGPASLSEIHAFSDQDGAFQLTNLPIGTYKLTITHISFRTHVMDSIQINLGVVTNLGPIEIIPGEIQLKEVVVLGNSQVLSADAQVSHSLSKSTLDKIPVGRDFKEAITVLPQVNTSYYGDGLSIAGGTGSENIFYLDGINVTSIYSPPGTGGVFTQTGFLPYNFIKEVKVSLSGYEAQYGKALGGNVDVVTQSGSNDFKGQVFGFLSSSFLNSTPKGGTTGSAVNKTENYDVGFSIGGPVIKDKLWYYAAYSYYHNERGVEVKGHGYYPDKTINHVLATKLDWLVSPKTKLNLTVLANPSVVTPVYGYSYYYIYPDSIQDPESVLAKYESGGLNGILKGHTRINEKTELDYAVNYYKHRSKYSGTTDFGIHEPVYQDLTTGILSGGLGWNEDIKSSKVGGQVAVSHRTKKHSFKVGAETEYNALDGRDFTTSPANIQHLPNGIYWTQYLSRDNNFHSSTYAAFIQDNWSVANRLYLQLGFRWDGLSLGDDEIVFQKFNNQYQPRIGISWFLNEDETQKLSLYYGRVYQMVGPLYARTYGTSLTIYNLLYAEDPRIPGSAPFDTFPLPSSNYGETNYNLDNVDQFSIEYQQLVAPGLSFHVAGLYKYLRDGFFRALNYPIQTFLVGNPGSGDLNFLPQATRTYLALETGLEGYFVNNFKYSVQYILSVNFGNYPGGYRAEDRILVWAGNSGVWTQPLISNSTGLLPNDRTHVLKVNAAYSFAFGLTAGIYFTLQSGTPLSVYSPGPFLVPLVYLEPRGSSGRNPTLWDINFRFGYQPEKIPAKLFLDVFHVGDPQAIVDQDQLKFLDYEQIETNPNFGKPVSYQPPMAIRIGAEYNF